VRRCRASQPKVPYFAGRNITHYVTSPSLRMNAPPRSPAEIHRQVVRCQVACFGGNVSDLGDRKMGC
jgi:hypothetical protein